MRRFHSYGPVQSQAHFFVERRELIERCIDQLIGSPEEGGGHYFTMWGPRQTGKTWLMRRAAEEIRARYGEHFLVGTLTLQGLFSDPTEFSTELFLRQTPFLIREAFSKDVPQPANWMEWTQLFAKENGAFDRPVILLIDEFDSLPPPLLDQWVSQFRKIYLDRTLYQLHGLALIGVRAVLGIDSPRSSPFNIQRSLHVPNLTRDEVAELFRQYQSESGQHIEPEVVEQVFLVTLGQPGLVGWFGELLTEKYKPEFPHPIGLDTWQRVYAAACQIEPNNTVLNLLKKATGEYRAHVVELFSRADIPFSFGQPWCNFLYLNGVIDHQESRSPGGIHYTCRFSSPFVQHRLFSDLSSDVLAPRDRILPLEPLDTLSDVFLADGLKVPPLLRRYGGYLGRLQMNEEKPWAHQPLRKDLRPYEAPGHFHLYAWLLAAVGRRCVVTPEFPTGNGKVDLVLQWKGFMGLIEVKSFVDTYELGLAQEQAAGYGKKLGLQEAAVAVFLPVHDEEVLAKLSGDRELGGVVVTTVAIGWG